MQRTRKRAINLQRASGLVSTEEPTIRTDLPEVITERIQTRLPGRIRDLNVRRSGNRIILEGRCATYYSKQLAQHAALGVIDGEQLQNDIFVAVPR
jgi:hypothetical protein